MFYSNQGNTTTFYMSGETGTVLRNGDLLSVGVRGSRSGSVPMECPSVPLIEVSCDGTARILLHPELQ